MATAKGKFAQFISDRSGIAFPYSEMKKWVRKCYLEHVKHNVSGLMLIFAKTDTIAWHDYIFGGKAEIWFLQGRVHFYQNGIPSKNPAPFGSAFICYRKKYI